MTKPLAGRVAVITGASRGIGFAAAKAIAAAGAHVVAVSRTAGGLEDLDDAIRQAGGSATLVPLDVTDYDGIDRLGGVIQQRWGKLDIFVGNAGILGPVSPLPHVEPKPFESVMAINVTANFRLIRSFDPLLRLSDAGRVVLISSGAAHNGRAYWGPYAASKAALEALMRAYAAENERTSIRVMAVNPGPLRTAMRAEAFPGEDAMTLKTPDDLAPHILRMVSPGWSETGKLFDFPKQTVIG